MTTSRPPVTDLPSQTSTIGPSSKIARPHALTQMPCPNSVRNLPLPRDTPGPSPDETRIERKSYAAALQSRAARPTSGPLGQHDDAWPPLASMATDPPPKQFVLAKDPVPPDRPHFKNKRRRRPRTRRHRKQQRDNPPTHPSSIKSETDLLTLLSSFVSELQSQSLVQLKEIFEERIKNLKNEIIHNLKNALRIAIKKLRTKLRAQIDSLQKDIRENHHRTRRNDHNKQQREFPPRKEKNDYVLETCISTDEDKSSSDKLSHSTGKSNSHNMTNSGSSSNSSLATNEQQEQLEDVSEQFGPRAESLVATSPRNHGVVESATQLVPNFFDCHLMEINNSVEHFTEETYEDDGGMSDGGWSASGASAQADY